LNERKRKGLGAIRNKETAVNRLAYGIPKYDKRRREESIGEKVKPEQYNIKFSVVQLFLFMIRESNLQKQPRSWGLSSLRPPGETSLIKKVNKSRENHKNKKNKQKETGVDWACSRSC